MQGCVKQEKVVRGHIDTGKLKFKELCTICMFKKGTYIQTLIFENSCWVITLATLFGYKWEATWMQIFPIRILQFRGHLNACHHHPLKASQEIWSPKCPLTSFTSVIVTKVFLKSFEATRMLVKLLMGNLDDMVLSTYIHHWWSTTFWSF